MKPYEKAEKFLRLHHKFDPILLYNIWDLDSAKAVSQAGAEALATSSWSMAAAQGLEDGQKLPMEYVLEATKRIAVSTDLPVTVDFEGGYATAPGEIFKNVSRLLQAGAIGVNFEDQMIGGTGLCDASEQAVRIGAVRSAADAEGIPAVINARTDLFLQEKDTTKHANLVNEAIHRAAIYKKAGADCFFVPGILDACLISQIGNSVDLPVNVMVLDTSADLTGIIQTGVERISFGPAPYIAAMVNIEKTARKLFIEFPRT